MYVFAAGGSGGHVFPAINLAKYMREHNENIEFITDGRGLTYMDSSFEFMQLIMRRKTFFYPFDILKSIIRSIKFLKNKKAKCIVGFGGYPSLPVCLAAFFLRIPFVLHEQNAVLGKANKFLSYLTPYLFSAFKLLKGVCIGTFLKNEIEALSYRPITLPSKPYKCLVVGGSQGSKELSDMIPNIIPTDYIVKHQAREEDQERVLEAYENRGIKASVEPFFYKIEDEYAWADIIISRAGSSSIFELMAVKKPAILIPLKAGGQLENSKRTEDIFHICQTKEEVLEALNHISSSYKTECEKVESFSFLNSKQHMYNFLKKIFK